MMYVNQVVFEPGKKSRDKRKMTQAAPTSGIRSKRIKPVRYVCFGVCWKVRSMI